MDQLAGPLALIAHHHRLRFEHGYRGAPRSPRRAWRICTSQTVRDQIRDKLPYLLEDTGEQNVKNIARPVRVYARCAPEPSPACRR
jgi:hypothetical protein